MNKMISKELLTAIRKDEHKVLNTDFNYIEEDNKIGYFLDNRHWYFINIYELAHKCKEWAFEFRFDNKPTNNRYYMQRSGYEDKFNVEKQKREKLGYMTLTFGCLGHTKTFYADTEPEAIFKACEWILTKDSK